MVANLAAWTSRWSSLKAARDVHISVKSVDDGDGAIFPGMRKAVSRHHNLHLHLQASLCSSMDMNNIHTQITRQECLCFM